jgi:hypothetical protein
MINEAAVKERVERAWASVFKTSNAILYQAKYYGFYCMQEIPDPNIHAMLVKLQMFTALFDIIIAQEDVPGVEYEQTRLMLNAKEQLARMGRVAAALKANNREDFDKAILEVETQAAF